ncbi:MAG TPA: type II toxin-antitoxin system RelE/ParE family toxin [Burkholderiales bacterium]|nr:type II toxin-antitoxin system RelE/ParE family toxin [Burkholderiales bacterium]
MNGASARRLDWNRRALDAYVSILVRIASEDRRTAFLVEERIDRALASILAHPRIGTPGPRRGERIFAIPNTGHLIHYRILARSIRVTLWRRARQAIHQ